MNAHDSQTAVRHRPAGPPHFHRAFIPERTILQRERTDVPLWLWTVGMTVLAIALMPLMLLAWSLRRLGRAGAAQGKVAPRTRAHGRRRLVPGWSA